jgi:hypothetical protein
MSIVESSMSCHIGEQLGYDQPELPAAFALKPQIIRRTHISHFNRMFRRHFGETPSGVRAASTMREQKYWERPESKTDYATRCSRDGDSSTHDRKLSQGSNCCCAARCARRRPDGPKFQQS